MVNSLDYHPCLSILASKILSFYISVNYLWLYLSLQNYCWIFSQTSLFHHVWEKYSNLWSSHSWKMHRFEAFLLMPPHSKLAPRFLLSPPRKKDITQSPRQHSFENLFPPTTERGGRNYDLLYQNSVRKYEDNLAL